MLNDTIIHFTHYTPSKYGVCLPTHLVPSIVWWHIKTVVVTKFCREYREKELQKSRTSVTALNFIDSVNSLNASASCHFVCNITVDSIYPRATGRYVTISDKDINVLR